MIRDITIGQYYQTDSVIHRLDPRTKIIGTLIYVISLFVFESVTGYILAMFFLTSIIIMSKVPLTYIIKGLKSIVILLLFTVICQIFMTAGGRIVWDLGFTRIYSEGLINAAYLGFRLIFLVIGSSMMTYTTSPNQLTDGFESIMKPLKIFKIEVHDIAMMMSIALRYIPILLDEADKIMKAQMARGADFETGGIIKRAKNLIPLLVPLFVAAFRRASELALAMEARCYRGGEGRTKMKPLRYTMRDLWAYFIICGIIVLQIVLMI